MGNFGVKEMAWPFERVDLDAVRSWIAGRFAVEALGAPKREVVCKIGTQEVLLDVARVTAKVQAKVEWKYLPV